MENSSIKASDRGVTVGLLRCHTYKFLCKVMWPVILQTIVD